MLASKNVYCDHSSMMCLMNMKTKASVHQIFYTNKEKTEEKTVETIAILTLRKESGVWCVGVLQEL